jgi:predicted ATP-dependent endonuclease of OLD family
MRLSKLKIRGYRSIKKDEALVTEQRVTILIGANDHGKSNLLAAILCLNDNHPITTAIGISIRPTRSRSFGISR